MIRLQCPYCRGVVEVEQKFFNDENRVCCMSCNKAFDIEELKTRYYGNLSEEDVEALANESFNYNDEE